MAIVAMRRKRGTDEVLDDLIKHRAIQVRRHRPRRLENQDEDTLFKDEYLWILDENYDIADLEAKLNEVQTAQLAVVGHGQLNEWSYDKAVAGDIHEVESPIHQSTKPEDEAYELEGNALGHERSAEQHFISVEDWIEEKEVNNGSNGPQKTSKLRFKLGYRLRKAWK